MIITYRYQGYGNRPQYVFGLGYFGLSVGDGAPSTALIGTWRNVTYLESRGLMAHLQARSPIINLETQNPTVSTDVGSGTLIVEARNGNLE